MCSDVDVGAQALESREDTTEMETPPDGGIGRRTGLRIRRRKSCKFEACLGDQHRVSSSIGRTPVSKTGGCRFETCDARHVMARELAVRPHSSAGGSARLVSERSSVDPDCGLHPDLGRIRLVAQDTRFSSL